MVELAGRGSAINEATSSNFTDSPLHSPGNDPISIIALEKKFHIVILDYFFGL